MVVVPLYQNKYDCECPLEKKQNPPVSHPLADADRSTGTLVALFQIEAESMCFLKCISQIKYLK